MVREIAFDTIHKMIDTFAKKHALPEYRVRQFKEGFYRKYISSIGNLTVWPKNLRDAYETEEEWTSVLLIRESISPDGGTVKALFRLHDDITIETVLMKHTDGRNTICVSCQSGCPVACAFCATGKLGLRRNLTSTEIVDQVLYFARLLHSDDEVISNIVFMGMGEPMLNMQSVSQSIHELTDPGYMGMGDRRITVSSSGYVTQLRKFIDAGYKGKLAISLHAPNQSVRETIMPIAKVFKFADVIAIGDYYIEKVRRRLSYEYILIKDVNDAEEHARELSSVLAGKLVHVNLIPNNPVLGTGFEKPTVESMKRFSQILTDHGIANTLRVTMGDAIKAACGQLDGKE